MPKQIDLKPTEIRVEPQPKQPIFKQGGLLRLVAFAVIVGGGLLVGLVTQPIAHTMVVFLRGILGR